MKMIIEQVNSDGTVQAQSMKLEVLGGTGSPGPAPSWGGIAGILADQIDLRDVLDGKVGKEELASATGTIRVNGGYF